MVLNDNPVHTAYTRKGTEQMAVGDTSLAIESFKIAMGKGQTWNSVVARFQLINAYHSAGKNDEAEQLNEFDGAHYDWMGGMPMFADKMYKNIMRDVARERGLGLVEAGMLLNEFPSDYYDHCHPDANGHRKIAVILEDSILKALAENTNSNFPNIHEHGLRVRQAK